MATGKWTAGTSRTSGISAASLAAGANLLGSAIDNSTNLDAYLSVDLAWTCSVAATADKVIELYILYAIDGTNYEDGDAVPTDPKKPLTAVFADDGGTGAQRQARVNIPLAPYKFKILLKSELDQAASSVTLLAYTHNTDIS